MTENDLSNLGFNKNESQDGDSTYIYFDLDIGGVSLVSNDSDEWESEDLEITLEESDVVFKNYEDLSLFVDLLRRNVE